MYPTIFEILADLRKYKINPNRFDKLWSRHRWELGKHVSFFDGIEIPPKCHDEAVLQIVGEALTVLNCQSGTEMNVTYAAPQIKTANLQFVDENSANMYDLKSAEDATRLNEDTSDVELGDFFKRPVKIAEYEWGTGLSLSQTFNPWALFFDNKRVINRISNFNLLRSKLHLRVTLNGNGFQYGRAILAYNPLDSKDDFSPTAVLDEDVVQLSQLPHLYLNPTSSQGGDMMLPFFYHLNSVRQPSSLYSELGECYLKSINALKHANGASDKVTITIFAWAEDITLAVPTSEDNSLLIPQSGEIDEANEKGVISGPATAVANAASALSKVPVIGNYAKATEMPLRLIAGAAKSLGYCRPAVTKNPEPFRNTAISSLAVTNTPDTAMKVTVDEKQELTLDPDISGLSEDDSLNIKSIAGRESYLTTFDWAVGTAPDTLLWNARVDPVTWSQVGTPTSYHFPACAMAALPFKYWSGTMKFRFQIVASNYHKGRLRIAYDPNFFDAVPEYNVNYMHIVDIAEKNDFTISITNGQNVTLIDHHLPGSDSATQLYSSTRYTNKEEGNGVLQISVLNELTVPNSVVNNDIQVNVFVSMGDDFEVFVPDDHFQYFVLKPQSGSLSEDECVRSSFRDNSYFGDCDTCVHISNCIHDYLSYLCFTPRRDSFVVLDPQSGEHAVDKAPLDSEPIHEEVSPLNGEQGISDKTNLVFTGESIKSMRTMLKRYNLHTGFSPLDTFHNVISMSQNSYPYLRGNVSGAVHTAFGPVPYNFCNTVLLHWVTMAFAGWRGGIRWKFLPRGGWEHLTTMIERGGIRQGSQYSWSVSAPEAPVSESEAAAETVARSGTSPINDRPLAGKKGMVYAVHTVNPCVEIEMPFYSPARFIPGRVENWTGNITPDRYNEVMDYRAWGDSLEGEESYVDCYVAAAEDFQTYFFKGLPRMYYEPTPPVPV